MEREYRTLMLEPQWHPIKKVKRWWSKTDKGDFFAGCLIGGLCAMGGVAAFTPERMARWSFLRWVAFGITASPWVILALAIMVGVLLLVHEGLKWFHRHPPVKIRTRYRA